MGHKYRSSTKKYHSLKLPCKERERLEAAYQEALQKRDVLEAGLSEGVARFKSGKDREAKNQCEAALKHAIHILDELLAHQRKHGCVGRSLADPVPRLNVD